MGGGTEVSRHPAVWTGGRRKLGRDPHFGPWVRRIGTIRLPVLRVEPFAYLVRAICYQQLAGTAARTIHGRVVEVLGGAVTPERVAGTADEPLRGAGLSANKLAAIRDLTARTLSGEVRLDDLEAQSDGEIVARLTRVRGIGVWTAQMFLMFRLRRPDVWPVGDLGVRAGWARIHGRDAHPTPKELEAAGEAYRPWRSAAAWYCYRALEIDVPS